MYEVNESALPGVVCFWPDGARTAPQSEEWRGVPQSGW